MPPDTAERIFVEGAEDLHGSRTSHFYEAAFYSTAGVLTLLLPMLGSENVTGIVSKMIEIVPYRESWPLEFQASGMTVRQALGDLALAIHHIGSTSVPGLAAKDVIDIQVTVADLNTPLQAPLENIGFVFRDDIRQDHCPPGMDIVPEQLEKRFFKRVDRPVHLHVRVQERFNQRYALLCRDYLRMQPIAANAYGEIKRQLARYFPEDVEAYYDIKDPVFDVIMAGAFEWARCTAWQPGATDA